MGFTCILLTNTFLIGRYWDFNSSTNDKILDKSKLKGFAEDIIKVTPKLKFIFGRVENIV